MAGMCINHPKITARCKNLCQNCYQKQRYHAKSSVILNKELRKAERLVRENRKCTNHPERKASPNGLCDSCNVMVKYYSDIKFRKANNVAANKWRKNHLEIIRKRDIVRNRARTADQKRDRSLRRRYGIGLDVFEVMNSNQNGVCLLCNQPPAKGKRLHVDHCHQSGKVRGLLCHLCNWYLSKIEKDRSLLLKIGAYLDK